MSCLHFDSHVIIDVSGKDGADGKHGVQMSSIYESQAPMETPGKDGCDAMYPSPGECSGDISLYLFTQPGSQEVYVDGMCTWEKPWGKEHKIINPEHKVLPLGSPYEIRLRANGGKGGNGKNGEDGQRGGNGKRGRDATSTTNGTKGGNGAPGGRGGKGTCGSLGGDGGTIFVHVEERDTHLLLLVDHEEKAGIGGFAGLHGKGGPGGSGGRGGDGYISLEHNFVTEIYLDFEGQTKTRTVDHPQLITFSGGKNGCDGATGEDGSGPLMDGYPGEDGKFQIVVHGDDGQDRTYLDMYRLVVEDFELDTTLQHNLYEPGDHVTVRHIRVRNVGGMPTPNQTIYLGVHESKWIQTHRNELELTQSIAPGEQMELEGTLTFQLACPEQLFPFEPWEESTSVEIYTRMREVQRSVGNGYKQIRLSFPIVIEPIDSLRILIPGDVSRVQWKVRNVSSRSYTRKAQYRVQSDPCVVFYDEKRQELPKENDGSIVLTSPMEQVDYFGQDVVTYMGIRPDANLYEEKLFSVSLELETPTHSWCTVQSRSYTFQIYSRPRACSLRSGDVLLLITSRVQQEEINAWKELCSQMGLLWEIENLSLDPECNLRSFRGTTVIILNSSVETIMGPKYIHELLSKNDILDAFQRGIRFLLLGEANPKHFMLPEPTSSGVEQKEVHVMETLDEVKEERPDTNVSQWTDTNHFLSHLSILGSDIRSFCRQIHRVAILETYYVMAPKKEDFSQCIKDLDQKLHHILPNHNHVLTYEYNPKWMKGFTFRLGFVTVSFRSIPKYACKMMHHSYRLDSFQLDQFRDVQPLFFWSLTVPQRVRRFSDVLFCATHADQISHMKESLLADIWMEYEALNSGGWNDGLSQNETCQNMPSLFSLMDCMTHKRWAPTLSDASFFAGIRKMGQRKVWFYEYWLPNRRAKNLATVMEESYRLLLRTCSQMVRDQIQREEKIEESFSFLDKYTSSRIDWTSIWDTQLLHRMQLQHANQESEMCVIRTSIRNQRQQYKMPWECKRM